MRLVTGVLVLCLSLCAAACDDDPATSSTPDTNDGPADTTTADTTAPDPDTIDPDGTGEPADTTTPEDTAAPADTEAPDTSAPDTTDPADTSTPEDTSTSAGACDNDADLDVLAASEETLPKDIETCVFECLTAGATCAATCVERETGLSSGCSTCFGGVIACTVENCVVQCLDASSQACEDCRNTACTPAFEDCAGIAQP